MKPIFSTLRDAFILLLWGGGILTLAVTGKLSLYLHPSLKPFTIAGAVILCVMAGYVARSLFASRPSPHHDSCCSGHDHHHEESASFVADCAKTALLLVPVLLVLHIGGEGYTAAMVKNRGVVNDLAKLPAANGAPSRSSIESSSASVNSTSPVAASTPAPGPMPLQVIDLLYALQMPSYREEFEGKESEMIAQFIPMTTGNPKGDRFQAVRMFITCCAADAKPVGITVRANPIPNVPEMGWVKITGRPTFPMEGGKRTALLEASKVEPCDAPSEPFVY